MLQNSPFFLPHCPEEARGHSLCLFAGNYPASARRAKESGNRESLGWESRRDAQPRNRAAGWMGWGWGGGNPIANEMGEEA